MKEEEKRRGKNLYFDYYDRYEYFSLMFSAYKRIWWHIHIYTVVYKRDWLYWTKVVTMVTISERENTSGRNLRVGLSLAKVRGIISS